MQISIILFSYTLKLINLNMWEDIAGYRHYHQVSTKSLILHFFSLKIIIVVVNYCHCLCVSSCVCVGGAVCLCATGHLCKSEYNCQESVFFLYVVEAWSLLFLPCYSLQARWILQATIPSHSRSSGIVDVSHHIWYLLFQGEELR